MAATASIRLEAAEDRGVWAQAQRWAVKDGRLVPSSTGTGIDVAAWAGHGRSTERHLLIRGLSSVLANPLVREWLASDELRAVVHVDAALELDTRRVLEREAWRLTMVLAAPPKRDASNQDAS